MKKCYGYTRVSTVKQGEGVSLEAQKDAIEAFAARHDILISKWFEEKETAAKRGRPIFNRMVSELKQGKAAGMVTHKIDRSARNFADWAKIGDLADAGVAIHFATESLDFSSRGGRLTADIQAVIAADYIRNLREETMKGIQGRLKQGLYPFRAPLGYLDNGGGKAKTIDPVRGPLVRELFELYATENYSQWSLYKEAKAMGLRNHSDRPLSKTGIEQILRNPFYVGVIKIKTTNQSYQGIHEPLIPVSLFDRATAIRTDRGTKKTTKHQHLYRGLLRCGHCVGAMIPELQKGRVYYRCHLKSCPTKTVREDRLEHEIVKFLQEYCLTDQQVSELKTHFEEWLAERSDNAEADRAAFELAKLDARSTRLDDKLLDGVIDDELYKRKTTEVLLERQRWQTAAAEKAGNVTRLSALDQFLELAKNLCQTYVSAASAQKREIVKFATSNRLVHTKKLRLEPSKWVLGFRNAANMALCPPDRGTSRTFEEILEIIENPENLEITD